MPSTPRDDTRLGLFAVRCARGCGFTAIGSTKEHAQDGDDEHNRYHIAVDHGMARGHQ